MTARWVECGEFVTESERKAFQRIKNALASLPPRERPIGVRGAAMDSGRLPLPVSGGGEDWLILSNLNHVHDRNRRPDEIDLVVIGPPGVFVIEVKPWERTFLNGNTDLVDDTAIKTNDKAKRIRGTLARVGVNAFAAPRILLTADNPGLQPGGRTYCGVRTGGLADWKSLLDIDGASVLGPDDLDLAEQALHPAAYRRRTAGFDKIGEIDFDTDATQRVIDDSEAPFHRVWRGSHRRRQEKLVVHLYDLTARQGSHDAAVHEARRDFEAMQRVQHLDFVPRIYDSYTDHPDYPGEVAYFTLIDTLAQPVLARQDEPSWTLPKRLDFAVAALSAVDSLHRPSRHGVEPIIHRSINPETVRVMSTNSPMLIGFGFARILGAQTVVGSAPSPTWGPNKPFVAPEVQRHGLSEASAASDTYSICTTLLPVFERSVLQEAFGELSDDDDFLAGAAREALQAGTSHDKDSRASLSSLVEQLRSLVVRLESLSLPAPIPVEPPLAPEHWDEAHVVTLGDSRYRVIERLGEGGIGMTFKVVEVDPVRGDDLGIYVAKTIKKQDVAKDVARAYRLAKQHTAASQHIATIHEVAGAWSESSVMSLIEWVDGRSLNNFVGVMEIELEDRAAELGDQTVATLVLDWMGQVCEGLSALHRVNLVHGDVSPQNILARGDGLFEVLLTDFDTVIESGSSPRFWNPAYACPEVVAEAPIERGDDIFALAASMYAVVTDRTPFEHDGLIDRSQGLGWRDEDPWSTMRGFAQLRRFLDHATQPVRSHRFASAVDARTAIDGLLEELTYGGVAFANDGRATSNERSLVTEVFDAEGSRDTPTGDHREGDPIKRGEVALTRQVNPRLPRLLATYPGSRHGNDEARGLDSPLARETYVKSALDTHILDLVNTNEVSLVLLFGNAGDGKTALLQHLAHELGAAEPPSAASRVWRGETAMGIPVTMNFDGSASWGDRSADDLLDDMFNPFHDEHHKRDRVHLVAVNSGKLLEWVERVEDSERGETWLTRQLRQAMGSWANEDTPVEPDSRIRLIDLNARSLVGTLDPITGNESRKFLDSLVDRFLGSDDPAAWSVCESCSAQDRCPAFTTARAFRSAELGERIRERLGIALETCHQRGAIHITSRELRGALSYILFGLTTCDEIHDGVTSELDTFWNRAFDASSERRQGALLGELGVIDPANECDPQTDRHLIERELSGDGHARDLLPEALRDARRRAWFMDANADGSPTVTLVGGRHHRRFRRAALLDAGEKAELIADLCGGIARMDDLPARAFRYANQRGEVPIRISARTPTETILWTATRLDRFSLEPTTVTRSTDGLVDQLHTSLTLNYRSPTGAPIASLVINLELFDRLLQSHRGTQLTSALQAGTYAHLEAFAERLAREGSREVLGWHPSQPEEVYRVHVEMREGHQTIVRTPVTEALVHAK